MQVQPFDPSRRIVPSTSMIVASAEMLFGAADMARAILVSFDSCSSATATETKERQAVNASAEEIRNRTLDITVIDEPPKLLIILFMAFSTMPKYHPVTGEFN